MTAASAPPPADVERRCTCHPSEAPIPCARKYAWGDCMKAALAARDAEIARLTRERDEAVAERDRFRKAAEFAHDWIAGLPRELSFEDKRAAQAAIESSGAIWPDRADADGDRG